MFIDADLNGQRGPLEVAAANVPVYLDLNDNGMRDLAELATMTDSQGVYAFNNLAPGSYVVRILTPGAQQSSPTGYFGTGYAMVDAGTGVNPTQLFEMSLDGDVEFRGAPTTQRIQGLVRTNDGTFLGVSSQTDSIYRIDPLSGQETLIAQAPVDLVAGLAYDPATDIVYTVAEEAGLLVLRTVDPLSGALGTPVSNKATTLRAINFGSTFFDFDIDSEIATPIPRQPLSPFASTLDKRSDGVIFGLQGNALNQYDFPVAGSTAITVSTLSSPIEEISFGASDELFGVSASPSRFHRIDPLTGTVEAGIPITFNGASISGITGFDIAPDGTHYVLDSTHLYTFDPITGVAIQAPNRALPSFSPIFTSLSAAADGSLFATLFDTTTPLAQINPTTGLATRLGNDPAGSPYASVVVGSTAVSALGLTGLTGVSDLAFDTVGQRIVGFDNASDRFFEFTTGGVGSILATAARPIDSWSLAFNGTSFIMFDQADDPAFTATLVVDPDTGAVSDGFQASQRVPAESLFHAKRGDFPYRVTVASGETLDALDFGVTRTVTPPEIAASHPSVINEILLQSIDSTDGNFDLLTDQVIELRGQPGGRLNPNTYFVSVDEFDLSQGEITGVFDLSDQSFGVNGFLTLLQQNSPHQVHPDSAVLRAGGPGFTGLLGATFDSFTPFGAGYFLIETDVPPLIGDDVDSDDDGLLDASGIPGGWTILDSLSLQPFLGSQAYGQAYGRILLTESSSFDPNLRTVAPGTPIVIGNSYGYAARVGDSVGSSPDDWMFGATKIAADGSYHVHDFVSHLPRPFVYLDRELDHFGDSNFVGGVRGRIELFPPLGATDINGNPIPPQPAIGVTVFADTNGNGVRDFITHVVDPDDGVDPNNPVDPATGQRIHPLTHAYPGVTLSTADSIFSDQPINFEVRAIPEFNSFLFPSANQIFAHLGINFFNDNRKLRADFYEPVSQVSIQVIGAGFSSVVYGRIEAYNANGDLLSTAISQPLAGNSRQVITVQSPNHDIAYTLAYSDTDTFAGGSPFGRFDRLVYRQLEIADVTDSNGVFELKNLFPGDYDVTVLQNVEGLIGNVPTSVTVTRYENFVSNLAVRLNSPTVVDPSFEFSVDENSPVGTVIGVIDAADPDLQQIQYQIVSGAESGFVIESDTGVLSIGPAAIVDFEQSRQYNLTIAVSDPFGTQLTEVTVDVNDVNEAPLVTEAVFFVDEGAPGGTILGQINAVDPDVELDQTLLFEVLGGSGMGQFLLDSTNGRVSSAPQTVIDFEQQSEFTLNIRVSDNANPRLFTDFVQRIEVNDENDLPVITTTQLIIPENSVGVVGQIEVADPEQDQTHTFELLGGTGVPLFQLTRTGQVQVRPGATIDFEREDSYTLLVSAVDSGAPPLATRATVTLTISDVNEPPTLAQQRVSVAENSPGGTPVATLSVIDPDNSGSNYAIALLNQGDAGRFQFNLATRQLTVAPGANLDFETKPVHSLQFRITDPSGVDPPTTVPLAVDLLDENDPPLVITSQVVLSELASPGTIVGRIEIQIREPDADDEVTVAIVGGNAAPLFNLDAVTRVLTVAPGATFDADGNPAPLSLDVRVTDAGGLSSVRNIAIILNNVNEAPVIVIPPAPAPVVSGQPFELRIANNAIVDPEGSTFSVAIFDSAGSLPAWLKFDQATRTLSGLPTPRDVGSFPLTLRAFEPGPPELFNQVPFTVVVNVGQTPRTNQLNPRDVDANGDVSSSDALRVINYIERHGSGSSVIAPHPFTGFVDTSGNGTVTSLDALLVVNGLKEAPFSAAAAESIQADDEDERTEAIDRALLDLLGEFTLF